MAWIDIIDEDDADGQLAEIYRRLSGRNGRVDHILKIHGLNPESLTGHYEFYKTIMRGRSPLSRAQREMIAVVVSAVNDCHY